MKKQSLFLSLVSMSLIPCMTVVGVPNTLPTGGVINIGTGTIPAPVAGVLTITQTSTRLTINWTDFNIAAGNKVTFVQPAGGAVLNRVVAANPSSIYGTLEGNASVYLINPYGILVGASGQININNFVASTHDITDAAWDTALQNGTKLTFASSATTTIENRGTIAGTGVGSQVYLIARQVVNKGTITADQVGLAAGTSIELVPSGDERLTVVAGAVTAGTGVDNTAAGVIEAATTELKAAGGNAYALAINNGGAIRATKFGVVNGRVFLRATDTTSGLNGDITQDSGATLTAKNGGDSVDATITGKIVTLTGDIDAGTAGTISLDNSGAVSGTGVLSADTLTLNGAGNFGSSPSRINTAVNTISYAKSGGSAYILDSGAVNVHGTGTGNLDLAVASGVITVDAALAANNLLLRQAANLNADVTTTGIQFYQGAVNLGGNRILTGTDISFVSTLTGNGHNLTVNNSGQADFAGKVDGVGALVVSGSANADETIGSITPLGSVAFNGGITLAKGVVRTTGDQTINGVTLGANTTFTGANITLRNVTGGNKNLTVNGSGVTTFNGTLTGVNGLVTDAAGSTVVNGSLNAGSVAIHDAATMNVSASPAVTTTGNQTYDGGLTLSQNTVLTGVDVLVTTVTGGGKNLTVNASGATTINGAVSGVNALTTDAAGTVAVNSTISAGSVTLNDAATLNGGAVTTTAGQTYNGTVTLAQNTTLSGANVTLNTITGAGKNLTVNASGATTFNGVVSGVNALTTDAAGSTVINGGAVTTTGAQTYNDAVTLGANTVVASTGSGNINFASTVNADAAANNRTLTVNTAGATTFGGTVGGSQALASLTTDAAGTVSVKDVTVGTLTLNDTAATLNGTITTTADQTYANPVTLAGATVLVGPNVTINGTVTGGNNNLTVNASGATTINGAVSGVNALTTDAAGTVVVNNTISAGSVTLNDAATLNVASPSTVITTTGDQTYNGTVTLAQDTTLSGANVTLNNTLAGGSKNLTVNASGTTTFNGAVSGVNALTTDAAGSTVINGGAVTTTGAQTYNDAVTLGANTVVASTGSGNINFASTVNADAAANNRTLTVNTAGATTFGGTVGGSQALASLTTDAAGTVSVKDVTVGTLTLNDTAATLNGTITTTADQTYANPVTLAGATVLVGPNVTINGTVTGGNNNLTVNASGATTINGAVSGVNALTTDAAGTVVVNNTISAGSVTLNDTTTLNGGAVTTTADQTYNGAVTLAQDTTLTGVNVTLNNTVAGAGKNLFVNASGATTVNGAVSGLNALITDAPGTVVLNNTVSAGLVALYDSTTLNVSGTAITTVGDQYLYGAVTLAQDTTLVGANVSFNNTVAGAGKNLTVNASGATTFGGVVSGVGALTTDAAGTVALNAAVSAGSVALNDATTLNGGTVTTTADQHYNGAVTLAQDTTLNGVNVTLNNTVAGAGKNLTVNASGATTLNGAVSGVNALTTDTAGTTVVNNSLAANSVTLHDAVTLNNGGVTTTGNQTFDGSLTLAQNTTLTGVDVLVKNVTGGGNNLTLNSSGVATVDGATGVNTLVSDAAGTVVVKGPVTVGTLTLNDTAATLSGTITTTADQTYANPVTLAGATVLVGPNVTLNGTVTGGNNDLTVNASGATTVNGAVSGVNALTTDAAGTTVVNNTISAGSVTLHDAVTMNVSSSPAVTTTGNQTYDGGLTLSQNTALTGVDVSVKNVTGGGNNLTLNSSGVATVDGATGVNTLVSDAAGTVVVKGPVTVGTLTLNDTAATLSGTITTSAGQTYANPVTLAGATVLVGPNVTLNGTVTGGNNNLTVNSAGATTLNGAVSGVNALTTDAAGTVVVNNTISASSVALNDAATLNGGTVTTTGNQTYNGAVTLGSDTTLNGANVSLNSTVTGGNRSLTVNAAGATTFGGAVSGVNTLTTDAAGTVALNASVSAATVVLNDAATLNGSTVTTTGNQTYNGAVTLAQDTTLTGVNVTVNNTVTGGNKNLTVNASGATTFGGVVSGVNALTTDAAGTVTLDASVSAGSVDLKDAATLNGSTVTTTGNQLYEGTVALAKDTTLTGANVTLKKAVTGGSKNLTVNASGATTFDGTVTGVNALTTDAPGTVVVNNNISATSVTLKDDATLNVSGTAITTTGNQDYQGKVDLSQNTTLTGANVKFEKGVVGPASVLTVNANTTFVGDSTAVYSLSALRIKGKANFGVTSSDPGTVTITTIGDQNYDGGIQANVTAYLIGRIHYQGSITAASGPPPAFVYDNGVSVGAVGLQDILVAILPNVKLPTFEGAKVESTESAGARPAGVSTRSSEIDQEGKYKKKKQVASTR